MLKKTHTYKTVLERKKRTEPVEYKTHLKFVFPNVNLIKSTLMFRPIIRTTPGQIATHTMTREYKHLFKGPLLILLNLWSTHTHGPLWVQKPVLWIQQGEIIKENTSKLCGRRQGINKLWPTTNPQPQTNTETEGHDCIYSRYQPTQL